MLFSQSFHTYRKWKMPSHLDFAHSWLSTPGPLPFSTRYEQLENCTSCGQISQKSYHPFDNILWRNLCFPKNHMRSRRFLYRLGFEARTMSWKIYSRERLSFQYRSSHHAISKFPRLWEFLNVVGSLTTNFTKKEHTLFYGFYKHREPRIWPKIEHHLNTSRRQASLP